MKTYFTFTLLFITISTFANPNATLKQNLDELRKVQLPTNIIFNTTFKDKDAPIEILYGYIIQDAKSLQEEASNLNKEYNKWDSHLQVIRDQLHAAKSKVTKDTLIDKSLEKKLGFPVNELEKYTNEINKLINLRNEKSNNLNRNYQLAIKSIQIKLSLGQLKEIMDVYKGSFNDCTFSSLNLVDDNKSLKFNLKDRHTESEIQFTLSEDRTPTLQYENDGLVIQLNRDASPSRGNVEIADAQSPNDITKFKIWMTNDGSPTMLMVYSLPPFNMEYKPNGLVDSLMDFFNGTENRFTKKYITCNETSNVANHPMPKVDNSRTNFGGVHSTPKPSSSTKKSVLSY